MNREKLLLAAGCAAFFTALASAQPSAAPQAPAAEWHAKNLQVLPKDLSRDQPLPIMKSFSQGLGVRCTHCHVGEEGKPLSTFDFASDAKKEKVTARKMLVMVHRINEQDFGVKDFKDVKVTCFTCHRGATKPLTAPPPAATPASAPATTERGGA
jgi:cytochrome c peroxidase